MEEVKVNLDERSYPILVGENLIMNAGTIFRERGITGKILIVTNPTVAQWYREPLEKSLLAADYTVSVALVPDGEEYKTLAQAERLYDNLTEGKFDRKSVLVALGGGVIGDLTGFVAATYMRGVGFVQIPTTLLAQVDSSIGGKTGVNHPRGKNLIGAFYQPRLVLSDMDTLRTLPEREFSAGMAEVIKHGLILDENYSRLVLGELALIRRLDPLILTWVVTGSCQIKAHVVETDERETGLRAVLNFGHTVGHAVESLTHYLRYKHGETVALGMLAAALIAEEIGMLEDPEYFDTLLRVCEVLHLPTEIEDLKISDIYETIYLDKKVDQGKIRWILPRRTGQVEIVSDVPEEAVRKSLRRLGGM